MSLSVSSRTANIIVVDIGGTWLKLRAMFQEVVLEMDAIHATALIRTHDPAQSLAKLVMDFAQSCKIDDYVLVATVPGFIGADFDEVLHTPNIPELHGVRLASELSSRLGRKVLIERDAILTLLGEHENGAARSSDFALGLFFGTGIGAAFLANGQPFRGGGWALEIGHTPCGADGQILEDRASGRALSELAVKHGVGVEALFRVAAGRPDLKQDLSRIVTIQAKAISTAVSLFSPQVIVLGGGVFEMDLYPRRKLEEQVKGMFSPKSVVHPEVRWSSLGWRSAIFGARRLVADSARGTTRRLGA